MKKVIFALIFVATILPSCTRDFVPDQEKTSDVVFTLSGVSSGEMTKAEVADLILSTIPAGPFTLSVVSTTDATRSYSVKTGEQVALAYDTYTVRCSYVPQVKDYCWHGNIYQAPRFEINTTIEVKEGTSEVIIQAAFDCWALVIDYAQVKKYLIADKNGNYVDLTAMLPDAEGEHGICYISCASTWTTSSPLILAAVPKDEENYETKFFSIVSSPNYEGVPVVNGKWFSFSPVAVGKSSGSVDITFPSWPNGN